MQTFINAKPSIIPNLGTEVLGAARHRNDTYDNPEREAAERKKKSDLKESKAQIESLKKLTVEFMPDSLPEIIATLENYETRLFQCQNMLEFSPYCKPYEDLKSWTLSQKSSELYNTYRLRFNKMLQNKRIIVYKIRSKEDAINWVQPKKREVDSFREMNGKTTAWQDATLRLDNSALTHVLNHCRAVQFGNSVTDSERAYVIFNLNLGLNWLKGLLPQFDINSLAYSFGARGNSKSVAYYQNSSKLISVNRHNEGSIVHEIGHAIDYQLNRISEAMPYSIRSKYSERVKDLPYNHREYLKKRTEIFARLFERYIYELAESHGANYFMLFIDPNSSSIPEWNEETKQYIEQCLERLKT